MLKLVNFAISPKTDPHSIVDIIEVNPRNKPNLKSLK